jgi:hypothetical protein
METTYRPETIPPRKKGSGLPRVLFAGCGCLVLLAILFGLFADKITQKISGPNRVVRKQIQAISRTDYQEAYALLTETYRKELSMQQFRQKMAPFQFLMPCRNVRINSISIQDSRATIGGTITGRDGSIIPITYELIQEHGRWRIRSFEWALPGDLQMVWGCPTANRRSGGRYS